MAQVVIIADDLTGALDSACAFALRGMATRVALTRDEFAAALHDEQIEVLAIPTGTRERAAEDAGRVVAQIVDVMAGFVGLVFKKVDSRLKGPIAAELGPLRAAFPRPVLAAPAIPAQGRYIRDGHVVGAGVSAPIPVAERLGIAARIPDIDNDAALDAVLGSDLTQHLYVGAAGLSAALARRLAPEIVAPTYDLPEPLLLAVGSRDPLTLAQIAASPLTPLPAPNGRVPELDPGLRQLVQLVPGAEAREAEEVSEQFAIGIAREFDRIQPRSLLACGGETAQAILRALNVGALDVLGEVLPGVPVARCPPGQKQTGLTVLTKSGGFGGPDLLKTLLSKFDK